MSDKKNIPGALPTGTIITSSTTQYVVEELLGAGGFGITYKVRRRSDGHIFALKEYFPDKLCERGDGTKMSYLKTNAETIETGLKDFITEAKRLDKQSISHPNIVAVDEVFKANNTAYYTMEYVKGDNLHQYIRNHHNKPLTVEQALSVMRPVLQAVATLHSHKLTHLDIKHENILLTVEEDGSLRPVLIDFGQAKHYDKKGNATSQLTNAGCSDGFAPQEQYLGLYQFTPQADVYALCATLLYLLTARQPVKSSDINASIITGMFPADTPARIKNAIVNGMRKDKEERTQSVELLADELGIDITSQDDEGNVTRLLTLSQRKGFDFNKYSKLIACVAAVLVIIGGIIFFTNKPSAPSNENLAMESDTELTDSINPTDTDNPAATLIASSQANIADAEVIPNTGKQEQDTQNEPQNDKKEEKPKQENINKEEEAPKQAPAPTPEPEKPKMSDKEMFQKAMSSNDWTTVKTLADKGYKDAYLPLAKHYISKAKTHNLADQYAKKAKDAGISGADDIISILDGLGYYD